MGVLVVVIISGLVTQHVQQGLEKLPSLESLVGSTASCVTQYRFGKLLFFKSLWYGTDLEELLFLKSLWLVPRPVVNPSTGLEELLFFKCLWKNYI